MLRGGACSDLHRAVVRRYTIEPMEVVEQAPRFSAREAEELTAACFRVNGTASRLPSERDQNYRLTAATGEDYVLKIANALEDPVLLQAENDAMAHVAATKLCPLPAAPDIAEAYGKDGHKHCVRLLTYLPGTPLGQVKRHSPELLDSLGAAVGKVDRALLDFDHVVLHRDHYWDLARAAEVSQQYRPELSDSAVEQSVDALLAQYNRRTAPLLDELPTSVIHNDANDYNVLTGGDDDLYSRNQSVTGLLDFGDMVHTHTVNGLAIALGYVFLSKRHPLGAAAHVVAGYHHVRPLSEIELHVLFDLACMRLVASACIGAHQTALRPDDPYLAISQQPVREALPKLADTHPRLAEAVFRKACALDPLPLSTRVSGWLALHRNSFSPVIDAPLADEPLDLSAGSQLPSSDPAQNRPVPFTQRLTHKFGAAFAAGGYAEGRTIRTDPHQLPDDQETVHLGVDLTAPVGATVMTPLDGTVVEVHPTRVLILHSPEEGVEFYTLYTDLDPQLEAGRKIRGGTILGTVATPASNTVGYTHVHVQLVTDLLGMGAHFPIYCKPSELSVWRSFCPDPAPLLKLPAPPPVTRATQDVLAARRRSIGGNLSISYRHPLQIVRGWKQYLYDETGRAWLDAYNNVAHIGHSHPRVLKAAQEQLALLNTNTRYLQSQLTDYAERLKSHFPRKLSVCYFVNSGSEANELAIRLARAYTGRRHTIVLEAAYHGNTNTCIDLSPYKHDGPGGSGAPDWVHTAAIPDVYRGQFRADDPQAGHHYAQQIGEIASRLREQGQGLCAYLAETCPSVGGQIVLPEGYLPEVYQQVHRAGGVNIADEVQTGFGRTGTHFWAFEAHSVTPDIVVLGKPIGNGWPLGAVVTTREIAEAFDNGMEFFSTFGGSTASCAVGRAVLEVVEEERLQEHALRTGRRLLAGLRELIHRYPIVGDVRGSGLFVGVELVRDRTTLEPAAAEASFIANRFRDHGILLGTDGPHHNVIKVRGPMTFDDSNSTRLVETFNKILAEDFQG
jgi:4-aminobutyrate aminotransferase-like enzyme/Ser/Thr protein kinase RdoA (MazF antagonist)